MHVVLGTAWAGESLVDYRPMHRLGRAARSVVDGLRKTPRSYMVVVRTADGSVRGQVRPFTRYQPGPGP